jgi:chloramphenicol O-acetyltransferase type A
MEKFELRRDRFEFFETFENPMLNITIRFECANFVTYCKSKDIPPFHFFLYCICQSIKKVENFNYRIFENKIIKVDQLVPSYTVMNKDGLFNYTKFEDHDDFDEFLKRSLKTKNEAESSAELINTGFCLSTRELKNYLFITSLPWFNFTSIQHPVFKAKSSDIPAISWGKFTRENDQLSMPLSIQAHHGFVDGQHIAQFENELKQTILNLINK